MTPVDTAQLRGLAASPRAGGKSTALALAADEIDALRSRLKAVLDLCDADRDRVVVGEHEPPFGLLPVLAVRRAAVGGPSD